MWTAQLRQSCGTGPGCLTPMCPRSLLEEECHTLERMIPILQVSCGPGLRCPEPFCRVDTPTSHLVCETHKRPCPCACVHVKVCESCVLFSHVHVPCVCVNPEDSG